MKNRIKIVLSSIIYTYLFYEQGAGVNILLLNLLLIPSLLFSDKSFLKNQHALLFASGAIVSSIFTFIYGNNLSVIANILSLAFLSVTIVLNKSSILTRIAHIVYNFASSFIQVIVRAIEKLKPVKVDENGVEKPKNNALIYFFCILVFTLFVSFYRYSNITFNSFVLQLNTNFISFKLIMFYFVGFILMYGYFRPQTIGMLSIYESSLPDSLANKPFAEYQFLGSTIFEINEYKAGTIMLSLLNLLLLLVNVLDLPYIFSGSLPENISYSEYLHQGIFSLILSIITAISLLLWYFRGSLNYFEKKTLKILAIIWILQNLVLVFSAIYKNYLYIDEFDLTYKRIGVYLFLTCTIAGLALTYIKIVYTRSNWFLVKSNSLIWYLILILSVTVNWDQQIASYNIKQAVAKNRIPDLDYLYSLSYQAYPLVFKYDYDRMAKTKSLINSKDKTGIKMIPGEGMIKLSRLLREEDKYTWQSYNIARCNMYDELSILFKPDYKNESFKDFLRLQTYAACRNLF